MPLSPFHDKESVRRGEEHDIPLQDGVMQPLTPQTTHIIPPDDVAPTTSPILDKHSNEFGEVFSDITRIAKMADVLNKLSLSDLRSSIRLHKWYQSFALRNFDLEDMEFKSAHSNTTAKLPILKLVTKMYVPVTAEEKTNNKNDVKARSLLLMAFPNERQLTFSQYTDAKTLLQKIVSRLAILGVVISQEDLNSKILSSLPPEWNTHVVVWMNKLEIETMSIDDLYNNFKIVEQKVKKSVGASSGAQNLAFMTAPSTSSTNDINTAIPAYEVSTASPNINTANPQVSTANFSDNAMYAFMVENPNGSNLLQQDLEQIHEDDLEAMNLKWQLSLLTMRAKRKQGNNEDTSSKALLAIDGVGFDWSDMAEEQCDDLIVKLNQTEFIAATYKIGLATVEELLITYRKNEVLFSKEVAVIKREVACKDYEINVLKSEFEKVKQEKEVIEFKIEKFDKASKDLDKPKILILSYSGLNKLNEPEFKGYGSENSSKANFVCDKNPDDSKENTDVSWQAHNKMITVLVDSDALGILREHSLLSDYKDLMSYSSFNGNSNEGTSEEISQDCIVMLIWKDASYFDSPSKDVDFGEPKYAADDQKQVEDGLDNENDEKDKSDDDCMS
ncbi:hypothetical protein Tco_1557036 [Tanacetum coccineum]